MLGNFWRNIEKEYDEQKVIHFHGGCHKCTR